MYTGYYSILLYYSTWRQIVYGIFNDVTLLQHNEIDSNGWGAQNILSVEYVLFSLYYIYKAFYFIKALFIVDESNPVLSGFRMYGKSFFYTKLLSIFYTAH